MSDVKLDDADNVGTDIGDGAGRKGFRCAGSDTDSDAVPVFGRVVLALGASGGGNSVEIVRPREVRPGRRRRRCRGGSGGSPSSACFRSIARKGGEGGEMCPCAVNESFKLARNQ